MALSRRGKGDCFQCARGRSHLFTQKVPLFHILVMGDGPSEGKRFWGAL